MNTVTSRSRNLPLLSGGVVQKLTFVLLFAVALALRVSLFPIVTGDYTAFLSPWYDFIRSHGGFAALKYDFANYNPPYLYLLAFVTYLPIPKIDAIKSISVLLDLLLALFAYLILRLKYRQGYLPLVGATVVIFTPTIVINSSAWGQCDAIYTAFCLGSLYFLLSKRPFWAAVFFGIAISFKLQAIFFLPVLLIYVLKREMPWGHLLVIPLVALLLLAPAYVAGRDVASLLTVYVEQIDSGGVGDGAGTNQRSNAAPAGDNATRLPNGENRQRAAGALTAARPELQRGGFRGAQGTTTRPEIPRAALANAFRAGASSYSSLTYNAPSIYQWFSGTPLANNAWIGITLAGLSVALAAALLLKSNSLLTTAVVMNLCLMCLVVIPFLLPKMHERYFYMADVFCILYAFYFPRAFYVAILMQLISLFSYAPFLLNRVIIDLRYVAFAVLALAILSWAKLAKSAFQSQD